MLQKIIIIQIKQNYNKINSKCLFYVYYLNDNRQEIILDISLLNLQNYIIYTPNKKQLLHIINKYHKIYDISIALMVFQNKQIEFNSYLHKSNVYKLFYNRFTYDFIDLLPHTKIKQICNQYISKIKYVLQKDLQLSQQFIFVNDIETNIFFEIQKPGIYIDTLKFLQYHTQLQYLIDDNKLISNYNLNTITGRPSNTIGINLAALNKSNGQRQFIISRFNNGILLQIDFSAYHLALISEIIGVQFEKNSNIHKQLAKLYFNTNYPTQQQVKNGKQISFTILYGGIPQKYKYIQFFEKIDKYINTLWNQYINNSSVIPGINKYIPNISKKQVLFNYLIQNYETKNNVYIMQQIIQKLNINESKLILYTYDSMLFDIKRQQLKQVIKNIKAILQQNYKYLIHYNIGFNYNNMKKI